MMDSSMEMQQFQELEKKRKCIESEIDAFTEILKSVSRPSLLFVLIRCSRPLDQ